MKKFSILLLRAFVVATSIVLATTGVYFLNGGQTARVLSDWLVYVSFLTLGVGTLIGLGNLGYKRVPPLPGEPLEGRFERLVKDFLQVGTLGISIALAGPLCFGAAILVDQLFI